jgi:hypothetical protein
MKRFAPLFLIGSLLAAATAAQAHHGLTQEFDVEKQLTVTGTVSKVDWINPHIYFVLDVKQPTGGTQYLLETVPVAFARRAGVTKEMLLGGGKPVEVTMFTGRKDPHVGFARLIKFSDGRTLQLRGDR